MITGAVLAVAVLAGGGLSVEHDPLACVRIDTYPRVEAHGVPAGDVAAAEVHFRTGPGGWYRIPMTRAGEAWTALLPRPTTARDAFEYRVALTSTALGEPVTSPVVSVPVTPNCAGASEASVASSIVVTVPEGSPVVPPVPVGFSPTGVVAAEEARTGSSRRPLVLAGAGVVAAAVAAGAAASTGSTEPTGPDIPGFSVTNVAPTPASSISLSTGTLTVFVVMSHIPAQPLNFIWRVEMRQAGGPVCVVMQDVFRGAQNPVGLVFTAPLSPTGLCGATPLDTTEARLTIDISGDVVHDQTIRVPYRFEP